MKEKLMPKFKFGVKYFIEEQLEELEITEDYFLQVINFSKIEFENILNDTEIIPIFFAEKLSKLFSTSTEYWINIDKNYKQWQTNFLEKNNYSNLDK